jgi:hypothetical protein
LYAYVLLELKKKLSIKKYTTAVHMLLFESQLLMLGSTQPASEEHKNMMKKVPTVGHKFSVHNE